MLFSLVWITDRIEEGKWFTLHKNGIGFSIAAVYHNSPFTKSSEAYFRPNHFLRSIKLHPLPHNILIESFYLLTLAFKSVGNPEIVPKLLFPIVCDSNFQMMIDGRAFETLSRIYFFFTRIHLVIHSFWYVVHKILYMRRMRRGQKSQLHLLK